MNDDGVRGPLPLEIVFSFNIAGAYGPMHPTSKAYLKNLFHSFGNTQLLQKIFSINSLSETRVAVFAHGFHKNMEGIQSLDFTDDVRAVRRFVATTSDMKWGAREHCYELVLRKAQWLSWTPGSKRALVLIGCTRPHDGSHVGSVERIHWRLEARCLAQMGIAVYAVEVKLRDDATDFYREVAEITEGCHVTLEQCTPLDDVVTAIVSHLVSSETMEEFEQEVINQADDHYTSDMAQLFVSLRHHGDDLVTSLPKPQISTTTVMKTTKMTTWS
ncbi:hypothetical protein ACOMHN_024287 [Nucella lapillus]